MAIEGDARRSPIVGALRGTPRPSGAGLRATSKRTSPREAPLDAIIELNALYPGGMEAAVDAFAALWKASRIPGIRVKDEPASATATRDPIPGTRWVTAGCLQTVMTPSQARALVTRDRGGSSPSVIFKIWTDFELEPLIDRSAPTVKVDAAQASFAARGSGIVWAVIDSGIDGTHPHFRDLEIGREATAAANAVPATGATAGLHRDFTHFVSPNQPADEAPDPLVDVLGHGTHVAGIIAGRRPDDPDDVQVASSDEPLDGAGFVPRTKTGLIQGMAPQCELVSLKVFRQVDGAWKTSCAAVMAALEYLRTEVNSASGLTRVHGVNLSLGCDWDPEHYAAGQSPLCQLINRLVDSGVVVVVSAGNSGRAQSQSEASGSVAVLGSITEPGHAEDCITVGSTHRDAPHTFGISWTSSKGPTLDGRRKPDIVAPGEWITSAATGTVRASAGLPDPGPSVATYAEQSGTSMAAPHVSGVIAGFLSARPEYIGRPREVKRFVMETAVDLGREQPAQGAGLVDAMRMLTDC